MLSRDQPDQPDTATGPGSPATLVLCSPHVDVGPSCAQWLKLRELQARVDELERRSATDALTGVATRAALEHAGRRELSRQARYGHPCSLVFCDIDYFKAINDNYGHATGDSVLKAFAQALLQGARDLDVVGRIGGEEFGVLLPNTALSGALQTAERMRKALGFQWIEPVGGITASFGVAQAEPDDEWPAWLQRADAAMYEAKRAGRNRVAASTMRAPGAADSSSPGFLQLMWRDAYASGDPHIDGQHQKLFALANDVLTCALGGARRNLLSLLETLIADCRTHFHDEELILAAAGYPHVAQHAAHHRRLLDDAIRQYEQYAQGAGDAGALVNFLARDVIALHILREDRGYFSRMHHAAT